MQRPKPRIRFLEPGDRPEWALLWQAYLGFYKAKVPSGATDATWNRFHDPAEPMHALGAFVQDELLGIVHYLFHRSCWTVGDYCYLQDLFVHEAARGQGLGRALIEAVAEKARHSGASRVYWLTREDNLAARALYDKVAERSGFIQYRILLNTDQQQ